MAIKEDTKDEKIDFIWKGKDKSGNKTKGELSMRNEAAARSQLRKAGIRVISLKKKPKDLFAKRPQAITPADISVFARQTATMLEAGIPMVQALDIVGKSSKNASMGNLIMSMKSDIEGGDTFSEALKHNPLYFDDLFCSLVDAGEKAGVLETLLDKIATYKEKSESMKKKVKKALTYPIAVLAVAFIVTAILLIFVVPVFEDLFSSFGADLPAFTQMVIRFSEWAQSHWWKVVGGIYATIKIFKFFHNRSATFRHFMDKTLLKLPIIGDIVNQSALARFARTLATMSAAGVPLVDALEQVAGACGNIVYYEAVMKIREDVSTGQRLQLSMEQVGIFPHLMIQMVSIGEESGKIDDMLDKVADFYEEEVDNLVDNLSSLMEPFIMVILGTLVGGLIVAMYLPIFKLGAAVGG